jgi:hypothetical protein
MAQVFKKSKRISLGTDVISTADICVENTFMTDQKMYTNSSDSFWFTDINTQEPIDTKLQITTDCFHPNFPGKKYLIHCDGACSMGWSDDIFIQNFDMKIWETKASIPE